MIRYIDQLDAYVEACGIDKNDVLIVGSATLTILGGRENGDLDITFSKGVSRNYRKRHSLPMLYSFHSKVSGDVDIYLNRYSIVGVSDSEIFKKKLYHTYQGYRIVCPELEIACKMKKNRPKDIEDIERARALCPDGIDWKFVDQIVKRYSIRIEILSLFYRFIVRADRILGMSNSELS